MYMFFLKSRQRNELHDLLEIETINANKRRRALMILPKSFNAQMQGTIVILNPTIFDMRIVFVDSTAIYFLFYTRTAMIS